jgi:hypothetical protein
MEQSAITALRTTALVLALGTGLLVALSTSGWSGAPNQCLLQGDCYCEAARAGPVAQPANTWSLLGFAAAALWVAWRAGRDRADDSRVFLGSRLYPTLYAVSLAFMGIGAGFFHASLTEWGAILDVLSMLVWVCFLLYYNLRSLYAWTDRRFLVAYLATVAIAVLLRIFLVSAGLLAFAALHTGWIGTEVLVGMRPGRFGIARQLRRQRRYFWGYVGTNLVALAIWSESYAGGLLCDPSSLLQGHAVWHLLNAVAGALLYPYLRSERIIAEPAAQQGAAAAVSQRVPIALR